MPFSHPHAGMADNFAKVMKRALTDETKQIILEIKSQISLEKKFRGIDVYKAVLSGGVRDREQFKSWIARNPSVEMETWQPSI